MQVTALTYGRYVNGPPEDPTDSLLLFLSVTKKDACVKHIHRAEVEKTLPFTGFSSLLRHGTENLGKRDE